MHFDRGVSAGVDRGSENEAIANSSLAGATAGLILRLIAVWRMKIAV